MKIHQILLLLFVCSIIACKTDKKPSEDKEVITATDEKAVPHASTQTVPLVTLDEFEKMMDKESDTLYLYNFWATWCKPCIAEMPYFEKLAAELTDSKFKLVFVSIDKPKTLEKVQKFVNKKGIQNDVIVLNTRKTEEIINKVDKSWEGAIPATLFVDNQNKTRLFYQREFSYDELRAVVMPLMPMEL